MLYGSNFATIRDFRFTIAFFKWWVKLSVIAIFIYLLIYLFIYLNQSKVQ